MRFVPPPGAAPPDLTGATLPAVAFANVGELAVDAIVATLRLPLAARGADPNVLPACGHDAYDHLAGGGGGSGGGAPAGPATALELYGGGGGQGSTSTTTTNNNNNKLFVLQQRAPTVPGRQRAFAEAVARAAKQGGAARVLLLCGLDAAWRRERQLDDAAAHPLRTAVAGGAGGGGAAASSPTAAAGEVLARAAAEAAGALPLEATVEADEREAGGRLPPWTLLDALAAEGVPATLLCCFCSEGDNAPHGLALAAAALRTLARAGAAADGFDAAAATAAQLRMPRSWVGLYGRQPERALY